MSRHPEQRGMRSSRSLPRTFVIAHESPHTGSLRMVGR